MAGEGQVRPQAVPPGTPAAWAAAGLGVLAGSAAQLQQAALWSAGVQAALAAGGLALALAAFAVRRVAVSAALRAGLVFAAALLLAFAATAQRAALRLADALPPALEGRDLVLTGTVAQMPRESLIGTRFVFDVESATLDGQPVAEPARVSLGWYRGFDSEAWLAGPGAELRAGQRWQLPVRLRQPHGAMNPGGFDLELWLFEQGIRAGGAVRSRPGQPARLLGDAAGPVHAFERARQDVRDAIATRVADPAAAGVLAALAVGDQAAIERDDWDVFRATGVAHLMSISGLHVTMFAWLAAALVGWMWRRHRRLPLWWPAPVAARWGGLLAAAAYALLAGWGVPAQRTVWMLATVALLRQAGVRWPLPAVLLAAATVVTLADPWALLQPGFWLSFVAVALLAAAEPVSPPPAPAPHWRARTLALLRGGLRSQAVATVGLAPLSMVFFQQLSLVGFVANLVAIPLVTLVVTPLALLGVLLPPLWVLAAAVTQALMAGLGWLAALPLAVWSAAAAPPWAMAAGLLGGLVLILPWPWSRRWLGVPLLLPLLLPPVARPAEGRFELVAADVGQGTAVLVRTARHLLVYDTGPRYTPEADAAQRVLLPLLRHRGEDRVDRLVLSHRDTDHVGGAATLLRALPVADLRTSLGPEHPLRAAGVPHAPCTARDGWTWDGVRFEFLHPTPDDLAFAAKPNFVSCVLRVSGAQGSVLLAGDIEAPQEAALLSRGAAVRSDVLLVPHHGSRTSSTAAFVAAVAPHTAVVQAAYRSRFGHPAPDVVARYEARGATVLRSDRCGAWTWPADGAPPRCEREAARRYWHHRATAVP